MNDTTKISLTSQAVQLLFNAATKATWPRHLGNGTQYDLEWDDQARAKNMMLIAAFRSAVRERYAIKLGSDWVVGLEENWQPKASGGGRYELIDRYALIDLELSQDEYHAIYWLCLWMAHPASPGFVDAGKLDEIVYPLVREIEEWDQLMYDLGLREDEPTKIGTNGKG